MLTDKDFLNVLHTIYGGETWPKPKLHLLQGYLLHQGGATLDEAASAVRTSPRRLRDILASPYPVAAVLCTELHAVPALAMQRAAQALGNMLLGRCGEVQFEEIYRAEMHTQELQLVDERQGATDTDYRLLNGRGRRLFRLNIKFHGTAFRDSEKLVGLAPEDCFALATYKIRSALEKEKAEHLPYVFVIASALGTTALSIGSLVPAEIREATALMYHARTGGTKRFEDATVSYLESVGATAYINTLDALKAGEWYVVSAKRAFKLLRAKLFERVYALSVPHFTRAYSRAEVDMHFSLKDDLVPLTEFLRALRDGGPQLVTSRFSQGLY